MSIRLKWYHQAQFAGFYVAKEKGYFSKEGLDVDLTPGALDSPAIQMVAAGKDDLGVASAEDIILARSDHIPIKAIAVIFQQTPFCFMVRKEQGISKLEQLRGKKIGVQPGNHEVLTYRAMLRNAIPPMTEHDIKPTFVGDSLDDMLRTFVDTHKVDAWPSYSINEPLYLIQKRHLQTNLIRPGTYKVNIYGDTLFTTDIMISEHPEIVRAVLAAVKRGWQYSCEHRAEAVEITLRQDARLRDDPLQQELQKAMLSDECDHLLGDPVQFGVMTDDRWFEVYDMLLKGNFIGPDPDFRKAYTTSLP